MSLREFLPKLTKRDLIYLLVIIAAYLTTRLINLTALPIFVDEAIYSRWAQISLYDASWRFISLTDGKQPLFMWVAMLPLKLFADPLFATRLVSVFSGLVTVLGLWYAGFLSLNKRVGYLLSFLAVFSPFLFFYDRFAVVESMLAAGGIWLFNLGYLLIRSRRLDVALLLGLAAGLALLVKSPALVYFLLIPLVYPFAAKLPVKLKPTLRFGFLYAISAFLAAALYNIQRLSPWMHMIADKNDDFVIAPLTMLTEHPTRIISNFLDSQLWLSTYMTWPVYLLAIYGGVLLLRDNWRKFFFVSAWFWGPLMATVLSALLFRPRYILFAAPFLLFYVAYVLSKLTKAKLVPILFLLSLIPLRFFYLAYTDPLHMPLLKADWDYTSGWAAGSGVKEIASWLEERSRATDQDLYVYTEGTFGLLPHGLELYTHPNSQLKIIGLYPLSQLPPEEVLQNKELHPETYFILNNTQVDSTPEKLEEVVSYQKGDDSYIRLYRVQ